MTQNNFPMIDRCATGKRIKEVREQKGITVKACLLYTSGYDTVDGNKKYWKEDVDYTVTGKVMSPDNVDRHAEFVKTRCV